MIDLTNVDLFKDLTTIEGDIMVIDLHNDYYCSSLNYNRESKSLNIVFESNSNIRSERNKFCLLFKDATIEKFDLFLSRTKDTSTLNNFYRGKFEEKGELLEFSSLEERYFYVEFEKGDRFELFSKQVLLLAI